MSQITVGPATENEASACLALIPKAASWPVELVAAKRDGRVVGAAALSWRNQFSPAGFPFSIHVIEPERRQGIARRLFDTALQLSRGEAPGLWSLEPIVEGTPAAEFAAACGFSQGRREHHFEAFADSVLGLVGPLVSRLRERRKIPEDLQLLPLARAPLDQVARLISGTSGAPSSGTVERLIRYVGDGEAVGDRSRIAMRGDQAEGAMIWRRHGEVALVEMWAVHPRNRGWLSSILLEDGLARGRGEGVRRLRFHCDEKVRDTMSLAERCGATKRETLAYYYRSLEDEDR